MRGVMSSQCRPRLVLSPARARGRRIVPVLAAAAAAAAAAAEPLQADELAGVWEGALPAALLERVAAEAEFIFAPGPHAATDRAKSLWVPLRRPSSTEPAAPFALAHAVAALCGLR